MADLDDVPDLGIDTTPRGPARPGRGHRPLVPSSRALAWSRAFWGGAWSVATLAASALAWAFLEGTPGPAVPPPSQVPDHVRRTLDRMEADRLAGEAASAANAGVAEAEARAAEADPAAMTDRRLWREATPEGMALAWARRARPGSYRVVSARKLYAVLIASLEDTETGREWWLRAEMGPGSDDAELRLTEMQGR